MGFGAKPQENFEFGPSETLKSFNLTRFLNGKRQRFHDQYSIITILKKIARDGDLTNVNKRSSENAYIRFIHFMRMSTLRIGSTGGGIISLGTSLFTGK